MRNARQARVRALGGSGLNKRGAKPGKWVKRKLVGEAVPPPGARRIPLQLRTRLAWSRDGQSAVLRSLHTRYSKRDVFAWAGRSDHLILADGAASTMSGRYNHGRFAASAETELNRLAKEPVRSVPALPCVQVFTDS